ncbi:MAG: FAD-binding protein, partial [Bacteroidota bacterium]
MALEIRENQSLKNYNTFGIDVLGKYITRAHSEDEIKEAIEFSRHKQLPLLTLGGGSNVLFTKNQEAVILINRVLGKKIEAETESVYSVSAGAGENWHDFVMTAIENNWAGVEN